MSDISEKQHEANKQNALLGGVKTPEGKAISKYNATRHGILRESISEYEQIDYIRLFDDFCELYEPSNIAQEIIIERLVVAYIKLMRVSRAENEVMKTVLDPTVGLIMPKLYSKHGYEAILSSEQMATLTEVYSRYETAGRKSPLQGAKQARGAY